jgi:cobalt transporter subunit CbtA
MKNMVSSALFAGFVAGLLCALLQYLLVQPDIVLAERYEAGELTHFAGVTAEAGHDHSTHDHSTHDHGTADADADSLSLQRQGLTVLFAVLTYCGYGLILIAAINLASQIGIKIGLAQGVLWGLAGFLSFQMMPALGLPPELPGMPAAGLADRQIWWALTAIATGIGLWFLCYGSALWQRAVGAGVLAAPHVWGAPKVAAFAGIVPPELAASFAAHSLGVGLITWMVLGGALVTFWRPDSAR